MRTNPVEHPTMSALLIGGDWACAHNDLGTLAHDAELLAGCLAEPLRRELLDVARMCDEDSELAASRWFEIRERLKRVLRQS